VEDIGKKLGCGAHVTALRRLSVGPYLSEQMVTLDAIESLLSSDGQGAIDSLLLSAESIFSDWQEAYLSEAAIYYLRQGQAIISSDTLNPGKVRLLKKDGQFLGIGRVLDDGKIAPDKLIY
jgi:tRNA pseudouridine55 synthase